MLINDSLSLFPLTNMLIFLRPSFYRMLFIITDSFTPLNCIQLNCVSKALPSFIVQFDIVCTLFL